MPIKSNKNKINSEKSNDSFKLWQAFDDLIKKIVEFKWLVSFFVVFLFLQLYQIGFVSWDKVSYIFGGKWFCGNQIYLELIRPPLPSFLNCVFGAQDYSIFLTTAFAAIAYFAAIVLIYSKNKSILDQRILAVFAFLFPPLILGANYGSDLLALAFLMLAFAVSTPLKKGFFFALATLSRYNFLLFGLVLIWEQRKSPRNILLLLIPLVLLWFPWMIFNYLMTGNPLFSIYESSYLNVSQKGIIAPILAEQIFIIVLFIASFALSSILRKLSEAKNQAGILSAVMFLISGIKETRFINLLAPLIALNLAKEFNGSKKLFVFSLITFILIIASVFIYHNSLVSNFVVPQDSFIKDCRVASDKWVFFYDKGIVAECFFDVGPIDEYLLKGGSIVLYDYKNYDLNKYNLINRGDYVILKSDSCAPQPKKYISGSLRNNVFKWVRDTNSSFYDYSDWVN